LAAYAKRLFDIAACQDDCDNFGAVLSFGESGKLLHSTLEIAE
jgi:hypothetical protein